MDWLRFDTDWLPFNLVLLPRDRRQPAECIVAKRCNSDPVRVDIFLDFEEPPRTTRAAGRLETVGLQAGPAGPVPQT